MRDSLPALDPQATSAFTQIDARPITFQHVEAEKQVDILALEDGE